MPAIEEDQTPPESGSHPAAMRQSTAESVMDFPSPLLDNQDENQNRSGIDNSKPSDESLARPSGSSDIKFPAPAMGSILKRVPSKEHSSSQVSSDRSRVSFENVVRSSSENVSDAKAENIRNSTSSIRSFYSKVHDAASSICSRTNTSESDDPEIQFSIPEGGIAPLNRKSGQILPRKSNAVRRLSFGYRDPSERVSIERRVSVLTRKAKDTMATKEMTSQFNQKQRKEIVYKRWETGILEMESTDIVGSLDMGEAFFITISPEKVAHVKGFSNTFQSQPVSNVYDQHCLQYLKENILVLCFDADPFHHKNFTRLVPQFLKFDLLDGLERRVVAFVREVDVPDRKKVWGEALSPGGSTAAKFGKATDWSSDFPTSQRSSQSYDSILRPDVPWKDRRFKFVCVTQRQAELAAPVFGISLDLARTNPYIALGIIGMNNSRAHRKVLAN